LERFVEFGVLSRIGATEWALLPTFIIPKKDGRAQWILDFCELKRKTYPLPRIQDILKKRPGYEYFTKIDISMQYYAFELTKAARNLCVIITPFVKFNYNRVPMGGVKQSPDFAQEVMEHIFHDIKDTEVYIDEIGIWAKSWEHHQLVVAEVLRRLEVNGFTVNPLKCEWAVKETNWLGYWLTPEGLKSWKKKIDAILYMQPPASVKQVRSFIGAVSFYRDMFPSRSHLLTPLTNLTGK
jgi:hypothetical protein